MDNNWKEKMCGDCAFWDKQPTPPHDITQISGLCRRFPPTPTIIPTQNGNVNISGYPQLIPNYGACSEFVEDTNRVLESIADSGGLKRLVDN